MHHAHNHHRPPPTLAGGARSHTMPETPYVVPQPQPQPAPSPVNVNIDATPPTQPPPERQTEMGLSWGSLVQRAIGFGGPAVVILLAGMMIASPRGQELLFGIKPLDVPALVRETTETQMGHFRQEVENERKVLRAEIEAERKIAAVERARDRELFDLQFKNVNDALKEIKEILMAMNKRR